MYLRRVSGFINIQNRGVFKQGVYKFFFCERKILVGGFGIIFSKNLIKLKKFLVEVGILTPKSPLDTPLIKKNDMKELLIIIMIIISKCML